MLLFIGLNTGHCYVFFFRQDSSMSLLYTPSIRSPIKKSMSDRTSKSPDLSPVHTPRNSPYSASSNTDLSNERVSTVKKASSSSSSSSSLTFHFFDSILTRSASKPLTIKSHPKKSPTRSSSSSCPQSSLLSSSSSSSTSTSTMLEIPSQARCLYNYNAIKDDELCVHRGEYVHLINHDQENRWLVRRHTHRLSPTVQGWLPDFVLGLRCPSAPSTATTTTTTTTTENTSRLSPSVSPSSSLSSNSLHRL